MVKAYSMLKDFFIFLNSIFNSNAEYILRKTIEGYFNSVPSLTFNTIKTKQNKIMHAFHNSRYLQSK